MIGGCGTMIDVIIPARNEADTIGGVIDAFSPVPYIGSILIGIDPETRDDTELACSERECFWRRTPEPGKGQVIAHMLDYVESEHLVLCDADLTGLTPLHVQQYACECNRQTVGVADYPELSPVPWPVPMHVWAQMSGQRCLPTEIVRSVPLHGYTVEAFLNRAVDQAGLETVYRTLGGVKGKIRKNGIRMAELRRDREWIAEHWDESGNGDPATDWIDTMKRWLRS